MAGVGGVVAGIGSLASGLLGSSAAKSAASTEVAYEQNALDFEKGVYNTAQTNLTPWISGGQSALSQYEGGLGLGSTTGGGTGSSNLSQYWNQFTNTPYYTFPLAQSISSMNAAAAAKGESLSGGQITDIGKTAGGYASSNWNSYMSALNSLSNLGQSSATSLGTIGSNVANTVAGTTNQQASAAGSGILGSATGTSQAISGLSQILGGQSISGTGSSYGGGTSGSGSSSTGSGGLLQLASNLFGGGTSSSFPSGNVSGTQNNMDLLQGATYGSGNTFYS